MNDFQHEYSTFFLFLPQVVMGSWLPVITCDTQLLIYNQLQNCEEKVPFFWRGLSSRYARDIHGICYNWKGHLRNENVPEKWHTLHWICRLFWNLHQSYLIPCICFTAYKIHWYRIFLASEPILMRSSEALIFCFYLYVFLFIITFFSNLY